MTETSNRIVSEMSLQHLVDNQVAETWNLDFKLDIERDCNMLPSKKAKQEFLADLTSLANTFGGQLIFGISEDCGKASTIVGIDVEDVDQFESCLNNLVRDCVKPQLAGVEYSWIGLHSGKQVLIVSTQRSWNSPHVVDIGNHWRFYKRHSNGKHQMDITELKQTFDSSGNNRARAMKYRDERFEEITRKSHFIGGPIPEELKKLPSVILHLIPAMHGEGVIQTEPAKVIELLEGYVDISRLFCNWMLCFDGFCARSHDSPEGNVVSNLLLTREGVLEVILGNQLSLECDRRWLSSSYERVIVTIVRSFLTILRQLDVPPPFYTFLTLKGFPSYSILDRSYEPFRQINHRKITRDPMISYPIVIRNYTCDVPSVLKPLFDPVWNECGLKQSGNYNEDGSWRWNENQ